MSVKRRRMSKEEHQRLEQEKAERRSDARRDSENRRDQIDVLWGLKEQDCKSYQERRLIKGKKLKELLDCVGDTTNDDFADQVRDLVELVGLQDLEIEYEGRYRELCEWAETNAPDKLADLEHAHFRHRVEAWSRTLPKSTPKQLHERKRRGYERDGIGEIGRQFGGLPSLVPSLLGTLHEPICLDEIFKGGGVNMVRLESLFGIDRARFGKLSGFKRGQAFLYNYGAVVELMKRLLAEKADKRLSAAKGRQLRLWLCEDSDPGLRTRVLSGIALRIKSISMQKKVARAFVTVVHRYLPNSAKK